MDETIVAGLRSKVLMDTLFRRREQLDRIPTRNDPGEGRYRPAGVGRRRESSPAADLCVAGRSADIRCKSGSKRSSEKSPG
jgi:hypothetical protein